MTLWTSLETEAATLGKASADFAVRGLSIDTRTLKEGDLFVALKGERDGHDFVEAAFKAKAGAALVSRAVAGAKGPLLTVADTQRGLGGRQRRAADHLEFRVWERLARECVLLRRDVEQ